jgi:hypothetical protein
MKDFNLKNFLVENKLTNNSKELQEDPTSEKGEDYVKFCMEKFYEFRNLQMDPTITDQARKLYGEKAMEYYEKAMNQMSQDAKSIEESHFSTNFDTYRIGDEIELDPKYFTEFEFPEGMKGVVKFIDQADYADETPVYIVKIKNIDPLGDEHQEISVEYKQVK